MPIRTYNYSYIRDQLWSKYSQKVSVPTIIDRAKKNNFYFPSNATPISLEEHKELWQLFNLAFPDLKHTIEEIYADGEIVVGRLIFSGTHEGVFQGIPPTGKKVEFSGIEIFRFSEGKLAEFWSDADILGLMQQLGMEFKQKEKE